MSTVSRAFDNVTSSGGPSAGQHQGWHPPAFLDPFAGGRATSAASNNVFEIGTAAMQAAVAQVLGGGQRPSTPHGPGRSADASAVPGTVSSADPNQLQAFLGLPVPCASGIVVPLGSREMYIMPLMDDDSDPVSLLPPEAAVVILHNKAVKAIMSQTKVKSVRHAWHLSVYTPLHLSRHLAAVLPLSWHRPELESVPTRPAAHAAASGTGGISVPWRDGDEDGSPSPWWLRRTWDLILALMRAGEEVMGK